MKIPNYLSVNYWIENYLIKYLAAFLEKSGQGWKTVLGLLILVLNGIIQLCQGDTCQAYRHVFDILNQLPHSIINDAGITLLTAGIASKLVNYIPKK